MAERPYPKLHVSEKAERSLRRGHPWVYDAEITASDDVPENGAIVDVYSAKDRWLGAGFYSACSKIRVRVISRNTNDRFDEPFWERRIRYAVEYRRQVMGDDFEACRLVFGEADSFPGWTVDRYGDVLVSQVLSVGIEVRREMLYRLLVDVLASLGVTVRAIVERNDAPVRKLEGLETSVRLVDLPGLSTDFDGKLTIRENGILYRVDCLDGQKTGYFLDQKYNRLAAAKIAGGRRVLDCFTHTGAFALNCAAAGAAHVTAVDISEDAIAAARENAVLNGLDGVMDFRAVDVFDLLTAMAAEKNCPYDYIILDPPAFTKNRGTVGSAIRGYREINRRAMSLLPRGGYLATCSCSHFMTDPLFREMLAAAAADANVSLRQIEGRQQAPDHPILWNVPETDYLKFYLFQIV